MYIGVEIILAIAILAGIRLMSSPRTAAYGNRLAAVSLLAAILLILLRDKSATLPCILLSLIAGGVLGAVLAWRVTMLQMPQLVALLNGLGGAASMLTAFVAVSGAIGAVALPTRGTGGLAIIVGGITLSGSLVAAGKLHRILPQQPLRTPMALRLAVCVVLILLYVLILFGERQFGLSLSTWMLLIGGFALIAGP